MSNYLFRLEVPADKRSFTVAEALEATSAALHPDSDAEGPVMILSINKVEHRPLLKPLAGRPTGLTDEDWQALRGIWVGMPEPEFPMPLEQWQPYLDAFNSSPDKPEGWGLSALQRDPEFQSSLKREITSGEHRDVLERAVNSGAISLRNPMTGIPSELGWVGDAEPWLLTRAHMKAFCDLLAIELVDWPPHFVTSARPLEVPAALLALPDDARVSYEHNIARQRGSGITNAADYRGSIRDTMERQAEGHFTLNEAAQVLADSRPGLDPMETVKRFRLAHSKGELPIHQGGSRFPLEVGETVRDFWDTVEVSELDAWLRESVGYGFPTVESASLPALVATPAAERPQRKTWRDVAWAYVVGRLRAGKFRSAVELNHTLHAEAEREGSPFDKGEGHHRGSLWVREIAQPLKLKTIQNAWQELRTAAGLK